MLKLNPIFMLISVLLAPNLNKPILVGFEEIETTIALSLPFDNIVENRLTLYSDYSCDDKLTVSLSDSEHVFNSTETGWIRNYPYDFYGILISHKRAECMHNRDHRFNKLEVEQNLNRVTEKFKKRGTLSSLRFNRVENGINTNFITYSTTYYENGDTVLVLTALNKLIEVAFINSKYPMAVEQFDSTALNLIRSIEIKSIK